jgi:hypothetical protein
VPAQRLGRRSAGEQVAARVVRLSDDLLTLEEACFVEIDTAFAEHVTAAGDAYAAAWRRAPVGFPPGPTDERLLSALTGQHADCLSSTRGAVAGLAGQVRDLSLESIEEELGACEATLGKRFEGSAVAGARRARDRSDRLVTERLQDYEFAMMRGQQAFVEQVNAQMLLSRSYGEDQTKGAMRLFNAETNTLLGNGGRGVWYRASSGLKAAARDVSIRLASTTRTAAMEEFNAAVEAAD